MSLKAFRFEVENVRSGEKTAFIGDGETVESAFKDGIKNVTATFRPSSSGGGRNREHGLGVKAKDGTTVLRTLAEFEAKGDDAPVDELPVDELPV